MTQDERLEAPSGGYEFRVKSLVARRNGRRSIRRVRFELPDRHVMEVVPTPAEEPVQAESG